MAGAAADRSATASGAAIAKHLAGAAVVCAARRQTIRRAVAAVGLAKQSDLRFDVANPPSNEEKMRAGLRVLVYDEGDSYVGIVGRGRWIDGWVADLIPGTNRELDSKEFARLQNLTRRSAIRLL